jgi:photosystem II oxygen-evolving enhancer protein 1
MRYRTLVVIFLALCMSVLTACGEGPAADGPLTYDQIRGTGLANSCPQLGETSRGSISVETGNDYVITDLCLEPTSFFVKSEPTNQRQEATFIAGKPLTRYTSTIDQVTGDLQVGSDGVLTFFEESGFDFQAITVQLPGGEQVPFLFSIKELVATATTQPGSTSINTSTDFEGDYRVTAYRTSNFLDPKGRGLATGYDNAVALPAQADSEELVKENIKRFQVGQGHISLQVAKVNSTTGEIAGTFESLQPSDTDMGGKEPREVKIRGVFYARVEPKLA